MMQRSLPSGRSFGIVPIGAGDDRALQDGPIVLLRRVIAAAGRYKFRLALWVALCMSAAAIYAMTTPQTYSATATLLLEPRRSMASGRDVSGASALDLNRADSELQVIRSERLLRTVFDALGLATHPELSAQQPGAFSAWLRRATANLRTGFAIGRAPEQPAALPAPDDDRAAFQNFSRRFLARRVGQAYVVELSYNSTDPALPARVANGAAAAYVLQSVAFKAEAARAGTEFLQARLDALAAQVAAADHAVRAGALPETPVPDADARIIGAAQTPLGSNGPRPTLLLAFGAVFGLMSGLFAAAIATSISRRVERRGLAGETALPCLTTNEVPLGGRRQNALDETSANSLERKPNFMASMRELRTAVRTARLPGKPTEHAVVAIFGCGTGVGAREIGLGLSRCIAGGGRNVHLLSAASVPAKSGLDHVDLSRSVSDMLINRTQPDTITTKDFGGISVMPLVSDDRTGGVADFHDPAMTGLIAHLRRTGDVILDLDTLESTSDAIALAIQADIVVLAAAEGRSTYDEIAEIRTHLSRAGASILGIVLTQR